MERLCAYDPAYPRNRILREGLSRAGLEVVEARVPETRAFRRWPALARAWGRVSANSDMVLVPEFRHKDVPLAWGLSRLGGVLACRAALRVARSAADRASAGARFALDPDALAFLELEVRSVRLADALVVLQQQLF